MSTQTDCRTAAAPADPAWEPPIPGQRRVLASWADYLALARRIVARFHDQFELRHFDY